MAATDGITMTMRALDRLKMVHAIVEMGLKPGRAAERLGLSVRQIERLANRYRAEGARGLVSRRRAPVRHKPGPARAYPTD